MPLAAVHPDGLTSSKYYSWHWCSQAEWPRFPPRRCFRFLPYGCRSRGTGNSRGASWKNWKQCHLKLTARGLCINMIIIWLPRSCKLYIVAADKLPSLDKEGQGWFDPLALHIMNLYPTVFHYNNSNPSASICAGNASRKSVSSCLLSVTV